MDLKFKVNLGNLPTLGETLSQTKQILKCAGYVAKHKGNIRISVLIKNKESNVCIYA